MQSHHILCHAVSAQHKNLKVLRLSLEEEEVIALISWQRKKDFIYLLISNKTINVIACIRSNKTKQNHLHAMSLG